MTGDTGGIRLWTRDIKTGDGGHWKGDMVQGNWGRGVRDTRTLDRGHSDMSQGTGERRQQTPHRGHEAQGHRTGDRGQMTQ